MSAQAKLEEWEAAASLLNTIARQRMELQKKDDRIKAQEEAFASAATDKLGKKTNGKAELESVK